MNKKIIVIGILICLVLVGMNVTAGAPKIYKTKLWEKDSPNGSIVPRGAWGNFIAMEKSMVVGYSRATPFLSKTIYLYKVEVNNLQPSTTYVLINHNSKEDMPMAYWFSYISTDAGGDASVSGILNKPPVGKIWVVLASDFDTSEPLKGKFTAWNPTEYLFEDVVLH